MAQFTSSMAASHQQPGIREIIGTRLGGRESHYTRMYRVETTRRAYEDFLYGTGLPMAVNKPEGVDIQTFNPIEGLTKRLTPTATALGMEISEEAWDDDLYAGKGSAIREGAEGLADGLAERAEIDAHRPFNTEGFDGTTFTVLPDNSGFFATTHNPIAGGQGIAQSNRPATNADLNVTSLQTGLTAFRRYRDDQGKRIPSASRPVRIEYPPELEFVVPELLKSSNRPDTANRVVNALQGRLQDNGPNPYLDDTDSWFLRAEKVHTIFLWRWRPRMDSFDDRRARTAIHVAYQRYSFGPVGWLGWYGSPGE